MTQRVKTLTEGSNSKTISHKTVVCRKIITPFIAKIRLKKLGLIILSCSALIACDNASNENQLSSIPMRPVKVIEANNQGDATQRVLASTVISADSQNLSFRVNGSITSLPADIGDRLTQGELVAGLDQQPFILIVKEAKAQLAQAKANFRNADSQYQRTRELYSTEAASLADLENARASASSARATLSLAEEGLNSAELNLGYTQLLSPSTNCQVLSVPVAINENITAGQVIATIACGDELRLRTTVPESLINTIKMDMPVSIQIIANGVIPLSGKVVEIAVTNNNSAGYPVEISLESPPDSVKTGMAAEATFDIGSSNKRMIVPLIAVMSDTAGKFVFIAKPEGDHYEIVRQQVETGSLGNEGIEIVEGINPGQKVVVAGMSQISVGMKVTLYNSDES